MKPQILNITSPEWMSVFRGRREMSIETLPNGGRGLDNVYFDGDLSGLLQEDRRRIAIIGTRDITPAITNNIQHIVHTLAKGPENSDSSKKSIIISGLAVGTDTVAHKAALEMGLPTVAVMGAGLDMIYPHANSIIADKIRHTAECGLLTQFPDGSAPLAINFVERTKTMVLMSDAVIIPACRAKGTALLAARFAHSLGIPVFAIAGGPEETRNAGCNRLIKEKTADIIASFEELQDLAI